MYKTFDGQEVEDGWYTAQYKTEREVVFVNKGLLFTGPWLLDDGSYVFEVDNGDKHHDFIKVDLDK